MRVTGRLVPPGLTESKAAVLPFEQQSETRSAPPDSGLQYVPWLPALRAEDVSGERGVSGAALGAPRSFAA